jgi:hypothetical protein
MEATIQEFNAIREGINRKDIYPFHHRSFLGVTSWKQDPAKTRISCCNGNGKGSLDRFDLPIEGKFAQNEKVIQPLFLNHLRSSQDSNRHGKVKGSPFLLDIGWSEINGNSPGGKIMSLNSWLLP